MFKISIVQLGILFILSLFFVYISLFEAVFEYMNYIRKESVKEENEKVKKRVLYFLKNKEKYLIFRDILLLIIIGMYFYLLNIFFEYNLVITFLIAFLIFLLLQVSVKCFAKRNIYDNLYKSLKYLNFLYVILYPVTYLISIIYSIVIKNLNYNMQEYFKYTEEDIKMMVNSPNTKEVEIEEKAMIDSIFTFTDTMVKEIMTPRTSIIAFDKNDKLIDVWDEILEHEFSRIPIYSETIDDIVGILNTKELLKYDRLKDANLKLENLMKPILYVPETKTLTKMLEYFRKNQQHMAIIIDEYGGTLGLITIEDLVEEIVGEIRDEYDIEEENIKKITDNIYEILGETLVEEINEHLNLNIELSEEYDTISGYINYMLEKVAKVGDSVNVKDKYVIQVLSVDNKKIQKVKLVVIDKEKM